VQVSEHVSAMLQKQMPDKHEDPGMFTIPIVIGNNKFDKAMLDLGASINVLPSSIYESLALGPLTETGIVIQLADGSYVHPKGVIEDVLVKVDKLVFPADFFVLDMSENAKGPIMLGRPFMSTSRTKIDVFGGIMTMEFDGDIIEHTIHDDNSIDSICWINAFIPPDKENLVVNLVDPDVNPPDADSFARSVDLHAPISITDIIDNPPTTVLGDGPTFLTPQEKVPASAVMQVVENKPKRPPKKPKYGGDKKKEVKQVWRVAEVNGLRFKPFHSWFIKEILKAKVPKGPGAYG